ncbi:MAG: hypothetical protein IRZ32_14015 [Solirubrobacteraceae bacterium]|nr:hypothetical protein [Solirubrobacteraceae bacterium]
MAVTTATISPRTGRLLVRGRVGHGARGRVVVAYRVRLGGRTRTRSTTAPVVGGRFTARIALPRAWRSARGRVEVRYTGAGGAGTGRASVRVGR